MVVNLGELLKYYLVNSVMGLKKRIHDKRKNGRRMVNEKKLSVFLFGEKVRISEARERMEGETIFSLN